MDHMNQVKIVSFFEAFSLISKGATPYNIVSIRNPEESEEIHDVFKKYRDNYHSVFVMSFDDISEPMPGYIMPKEQDIKDVIDWSKGKDNLLVHCSAGISRSAAIAYLIECTRKPPKEAEKILRRSIHFPNMLILEIGSQILGDPNILKVLENHGH